MDRFSKAIEQAKNALLDSFGVTELFDEETDKNDLVEVTRCKDCKYADVLITGNIYCNHFSEWHLHGTDWFCADGERRDVNGI